MKRQLLRVEAQPLKRFRLSEVPEFIRQKALRTVYDQASWDGKRGMDLLDAVVMAAVAAREPSDRVYWVAQSSWDSMLVEAEKMRRSGEWKRYMTSGPGPADPRSGTADRRHVLAPGAEEFAAVAP